jgi:hypothetical protein
MDKPTDLLRPAAALVAVVFLLVGVIGFVPGLTSNVGDIEFAGHDSGAKLLGLFEVSVLHNVVHLLFGVVGLALARTWGGARAFLLGGAAVYALLTLYGAVIDQHGDANFVGLNTADNWLHLVLAAGMAALGVVLGRRPAAAHARA